MVMLTCQKRRKIVRKERDGSKREFFRCAHGATCTYRQEVDEQTCEGCVLRQVLLSQQPCSPKPPKEPVYKQATYGEDAEIRYECIDADLPECPDGYKRRSDDPWTFDPIWFPCPYRVFNNDLKPDGSIKINAYCALAKKPVDFKECDRCQGAITKVGATLNPEDIPEIPGLTIQVQNYWRAVKRWIAAGRPTRTDKEVKLLHESYCTRCDWYDEKSKRCKGCGCKVRAEGAAMLNKIRMATEHCPRNFW
jgi:hypothetical protein